MRNPRTVAIVTAVVLLLALLLIAGTSSGRSNADAPPTSTAPSTTVAPTTTLPTTTVPPPEVEVTTPTAVAGTSDDALIGSLRVEPAHSSAGYERTLFEHWIDADHDGCNTRCEVLLSERRTDLPGISSGWRSAYDGVTTGDPSTFDIDHVVALAEAWRSGADSWDAARRRAFANDLDLPDALIAVTAASNRSKSDKDPANWTPPDHADWCAYGRSWIEVKVKWDLSADPAEVTALRNVLSGC